METNHYTKTYKGIKLDVYRIIQIFEVNDPALQHALKKILRCGRSHKSAEQDAREVIESMERYIEMLKEDSLEREVIENIRRDMTPRPDFFGGPE